MIAAERTGPWRLSDLAEIDKNGLRVFSCFSCGGGSTMGYKLAGYDVIGCVDIDPKMMAVYQANHHPRYPFVGPVGALVTVADLPPDLFSLDVLDGSPPCSSFSTSGARDRKWGKSGKFREGQAEQVLDDLFFDFIRLADRLRPRVVVAENVKGLIVGKARGYVREIFAAFKAAGYTAQLFLLNAAAMGVPQRRERTIFVARRDDLALPPLRLSFVEPEIAVRDAVAGATFGRSGVRLTKETERLWSSVENGGKLSDAHPTGARFSHCRIDPSRPSPTLTSHGSDSLHWDEPRQLSAAERVRIQTFPDDYDFGAEKAEYVCGMSVPPYMMQRVALEIRRQMLPGDGLP